MKKIKCAKSCAFIALSILLTACSDHTEEGGSPYGEVPVIKPHLQVRVQNEVLSNERSGSDVISLIDSCRQNGSRELNIQGAVYRFQPDEVLHLEGLHDIAINGDGSTFLFNGKGRIIMKDCRNLSLENVNIDYDPLPFTQGRIVNVNPANRTVVATFDPNYSQPGDSVFPVDFSKKKVEGAIRFFNSEGTHMLAFMWDAVTSLTPLGDGQYEMTLKNNRIFTPGIKPGSLSAGDRFAMFVHTSIAVEIIGGESVTLENVNIYTADGFGVLENGGRGRNVYRNMNIRPKPGTDRLMSSCRDGFHSYLTEIGPRLENCEIAYTGDDCIAIHGFFSIVNRVLPERKLHLICPFGINVKKGGLLSFYDFETGAPAGQAQIVNLRELSAEEAKAETSDWRSRISAAGLRLRGFPAPTNTVVEITVDREIKLPTWAIADSYDFSGRGAKVVNCTIHDTIARGIMIRSPNASITGNNISHTSLPAIAIIPEQYWLESSFVTDVEIRGNTIHDAPAIPMDTRHFDYGFAAIQITSVFGDRLFNPPQFRSFIQNSDIVIEDNIIVRPAGPAIALFNASDARILGNRIEQPFYGGINNTPLNLMATLALDDASGTSPSERDVASAPYYGILLMHDEGVMLEGNVMVDASPEVMGILGVGPGTVDINDYSE